MKMRTLTTVVLALAILLAGCGTAPTAAPTATSAPTNTPFPPTWTPKPTLTLPPTWTPAPSATPGPATATNAVVATQGNTTGGTSSGDIAGFVADVTVPDGSIFKPGQTFTKTWKLQNNGTTTWTTAYKAYYVSGNQMGAPGEMTLPYEVPPGQQVEISVKMTAPANAGSYTGLWMLKNASNKSFGVGNNANEPFYLVIQVSPDGAAATVTPGGTTSTGIKSATLSVDKASYSGACPVNLTFTATVATQGSGSFTYELEAGASTSGFTFSLGSPQIATYSTTGTQSFVYTLNITSSVDGWAKLYISSPASLRSNELKFNVKCD